MDHEWQPADPEPGKIPDLAEDEPATPPRSPIAHEPVPLQKPRGVRRMLATLGLAVGLLTIGGASAVMAASPAPSSTPSASGGSTAPTTKHNCPNMGSNSGSTSSPSASPTN